MRVADALLDDYVEPTPFWGAKSTNSTVKKKNTGYLVSTCEAAGINPFVFDPRAPSGQLIKKVIPKKVDDREFLKQVNVKFAEATKISHYVF